MKTFRPENIFLIIFLILMPCAVHASFIRNYPISITQPDGQVLQCYVTGDEFYNWLHDAENFTIVRNDQTGFYCYAILKDNMLEASSYIAGKVDPASAGLVPGINLPPEKIMLIKKNFFEKMPVPKSGKGNVEKITGVINNIVVFIRFAGEAEFTDSLSIYDRMFVNTPGNSSLKNYFEEASFSQLHINSNYYPSPGTLVVSYQDALTRDYYLPYNATTNPHGYTDQMATEHTLLANAVNAVKSQIPAGMNLDNNNDGKVDNVCFIVSGDVSAWNTLLWPHRWMLNTQNVDINGKQVYDYNLQVRSYLLSSGVGVLCHEMFHTLGAPDLYHYSLDGLNPVDAWDVMANTTNPPQSMGAYMKFRYGQWITTLPVISAPGTYTLYPVTDQAKNCYRINSPNSADEYFIVEYRKKEGVFEGSLPGSGLVVYRINTNFNGMGDGYYNGSGFLDEVYIYRPYGSLTQNGLADNACFSANVSRRKINDGTNPSCFLSDGSPGSLDISNVTASGDSISFDLNGGPSFPVNAGIDDFISPVSGCGLSALQPITVAVKNFGTDPINNGLQLHYQVNGGAVVDENYPGPALAAGTATNFTFSQPADLSQTGVYHISAWTTLASDGHTVNDSLTVTVTNGMLGYNAADVMNYMGSYNDIGSNGSVINTADYDNSNSAPADIGFTFHYNCSDYTQFVLNTNGFIKLGSTPPSSAAIFFSGAQSAQGGIFNSDDAADINIISVFNHDLIAGTSAAEYRVFTSGTAPARVCTIQFKNLREKTTLPLQQFNNISFQIKLYETSNRIEMIYGNWQASANASEFKTAAVGLKGPGSDYGQLLVARKGSTQAWSNTIFENVNYSSDAALNFGNPPLRPAPESGRTFLFIPQMLPAVITTTASGITSFSAILNGSVNANGVVTLVFFEYGTDAAYGNTIAANPGSLSGTTSTPVSASISGLINNTTYHYRVVAINNLGTFYGNDISFVAGDVTGIKNENADTFVFHPNPADDRLFVDIPGLKENTILSILDLQGKVVFMQNVNHAGEEIMIDGLSKGMYLIKIADGEKCVVKKFVKK